jgi:sulfatase modifying factor 1
MQKDAMSTVYDGIIIGSGHTSPEFDRMDHVAACGACGTPRQHSPQPKLQLVQPGQSVVPARVVRLPGGRVRTGTDQPLLPQDGEGPSRPLKIDAFAIDPYAVTNRWFGEFVAATGYRTEAESFGWSAVFFAFLPENLGAAPGADAPSWWRRVEGACWRHPEGTQSSVEDRWDHPVVHVSWNDAQAFAIWAGGRLPTEAEWEYAAHGGITAGRFPWGESEPDDNAVLPCNIWQGTFPTSNTVADGFAGTAPVDTFEPNGFGLYNMVGNTWEWCADAFRIHSLAKSARLRNAAALESSERLMKGGSYLCHKSYCYRYRIAARSGVSSDSSTGHVGFRIVFDTN